MSAAKNKSIKLVAIILEVDGERKTIEKDFSFHGWAEDHEHWNDCGVDLSVKIDGKYKEIAI